MNRAILGIDDVSDAEIDWVIARAREYKDGRHRVALQSTSTPILGLLFMEASLRTRIGFSVAAHRLGWRTVDVFETRRSATSQPEPWTETLRVTSGMVDALVVRPSVPLDHGMMAQWCRCPILSGGDAGAASEHPSQALIDLFAVTEFVGPLEGLSVAIVGDLRTRSARSFLRLLCRRPPRRLVIVSHPALAPEGCIPFELGRVCEFGDLRNIGDVDVVSAIGLPDGVVDQATRRLLQVDRSTMDRLPEHAVVLSPMPVLDEIETAALDHQRLRVYEQSDQAVWVRAALLDLLALTHLV